MRRKGCGNWGRADPDGPRHGRRPPRGGPLRGAQPTAAAAVWLALGLLVGALATAASARAEPEATPTARPPAVGNGQLDAATYDLYESYPNFGRIRDGEFLAGFNDALADTDGHPSPTVLWFKLVANGAFEQFSSSPYDACHWDLLRWGDGPQGSLLYLSTHDSCSMTATDISYRPGIAFMPKTWTPGSAWSATGVSDTVYDENGIAVCEGVNTWASAVLGVVVLPGGIDAVHTQTNETQALSPVAGAPNSGACPSGAVTTTRWQENFYVDSSLVTQLTSSDTAGANIGLVLSAGGNMAVFADSGHPQWESHFVAWEPLPPEAAVAGDRLTTTEASVASGSSGNTIVFTFTAGEGGLHDGAVRIAVPPGWPAPVTVDTSGCTAATVGTVSTRGRTITVAGLTLAADATDVVSYGATAGGACTAGDAVTAPAVGGAATWYAEASSTPTGVIADLASSPAIDVDAADGTGTLTASPSTVAPDTSGTTLQLAYTAAPGGVTDGELTVTLPPQWTAPVSADAAGCTTATTGEVSTSGQTITLDDLTLAAGATAIISYGAVSGGPCAAGDAVSPPPDAGADTFAAQEASSPDGTPTSLAPPTVTVGG